MSNCRPSLFVSKLPSTPRDPRKSPPQSPRSSTFSFLDLHGGSKDTGSSRKTFVNRTANVRTSRQQVVTKISWLMNLRVHSQVPCRITNIEAQYLSDRTDREQAREGHRHAPIYTGYHFTTAPSRAMSSRLWFPMALWQDALLAGTDTFRMAED